MTTSRVPLVSTEGYAVWDVGRSVAEPCRYRRSGGRPGALRRVPCAARPVRRHNLLALARRPWMILPFDTAPRFRIHVRLVRHHLEDRASSDRSFASSSSPSQRAKTSVATPLPIRFVIEPASDK